MVGISFEGPNETNIVEYQIDGDGKYVKFELFVSCRVICMVPIYLISVIKHNLFYYVTN